MQTEVQVFGALLTSFDGLSITGDLGIDKDVDIVCGMLTVVGRFVEDTWGEEAEQIHLKGTVVSRLKGRYANLVLTTDGTSENLMENAKSFLQDIEEAYKERLTDWDGAEIEGLKDQFYHDLERLKIDTGADESQDIPVPGFDILSMDDFYKHIDEIEDTINGYHLLGDMDTALELARETIGKLEKRDPDTVLSSLFYAMAAKMMAEYRDVEKSRDMVQNAIEKSKDQDNKIALAEAYYVSALQNLFNNNPKQALSDSKDAVRVIKAHGVDQPRDFHRMIKYQIAQPWALDLLGLYEESIQGWKDLISMADSAPEGETDMEKATLRKHKINLYNNLGYTTISRNMMDRKLYEEAVEYYKLSYDIVRSTDARYCSPLVKLNLAQAYAFTRNWDEAERLAKEALEESRSQGNIYRFMCVERVHGIYHLLRGIDFGDKEELYEAIFHFKTALKGQTEKPEIETLRFFMNETEKALKELL